MNQKQNNQCFFSRNIYKLRFFKYLIYSACLWTRMETFQEESSKIENSGSYNGKNKDGFNYLWKKTFHNFYLFRQFWCTTISDSMAARLTKGYHFKTSPWNDRITRRKVGRKMKNVHWSWVYSIGAAILKKKKQTFP